MTTSTFRLVLAYGALAALVLLCLRLVSFAPLGLDWGRELVAAVIALIGVVVGLKLSQRRETREDRPAARESSPGPGQPALAGADVAAAEPAPAPAGTAIETGISPREQRVLESLARGLSNKEIARELQLSENTVKTHLANLYAKLGARRRTEALASAAGRDYWIERRAHPEITRSGDGPAPLAAASCRLPHDVELSMISTALRHGLIAGALISVFLWLPQALFGFQAEWAALMEVLGYTWMVLSMTAVIFAMRRERAAHGALTYGRGVAVGVAVSGVASVLFGIVTWLMLLVTVDEFAPRLMEYYATKVRNSGMGPAELARQLAELEAMRPMLYNTPLQGAIMGATVFLIGVVLSLLGAAFLRRP